MKKAPGLLLFPVIFAQMPIQFQMGKVMLTKGFIKNNGNRITQIQGSCFSQHGNPYASLLIVTENLFRDSSALLAKHDKAVVLILHIRISLRCFRSRIINLRSRISLQKIFIIQISIQRLVPSFQRVHF